MAAPRWTLSLFVALAGLAVFLNAVDGEFVYDDLTYVMKNPSVVDGAGVFTEATPPHRPELGLYRPITVLTYRWTFDAVGLDAEVFHAVNALLHAICCALLVAAALRLGASAPAAGVAGLLFALHPVHAESVAWIVGRAEILALLFSLLAVLAWGSPSGRDGPLRPLLAALAYAAAALSKESALPLPAILVGLDLLRSPRPGLRRLVRDALPLAVVALVLVAVRVAVLDRFGPENPPGSALASLTALERIRLAVVVPGRALRFLLWPHPLSIHYEPRDLDGTAPLLLGLATVAGVAFLLFRSLRRGGDPIGRGALIFAVALLPFLHLVPIGAIYADRFLYLPSAGFALVVGAALFPGRERPGATRSLVAAAALALLAGLTIVRNEAFDSNFALWRDAQRKDPTAALPAYQLGYFYYQAGILDHQSNERRGALYWWRRSIELDDRHPFAQDANLRLGEHAAGVLGDAKTAAAYYRRAIVLDKTRVEALLDLAALHRTPEVSTAEARALLEEVLRLDADEGERAAARSMLAELDAG